MSFSGVQRLKTINLRQSFVGWVRRNIIMDSITIGILAFVVFLTLVIFAATTNFAGPNCQPIYQFGSVTCQVHT
jgi:hypothetical protein